MCEWDKLEPKKEEGILDHLSEKTLNKETVYRGKIISVDIEEVELPNGQLAKREIVRHQGAVGILAVTPEDKMLMVRQFRKPLDRTIIEIPAGKLEQGENPLHCAKRELKEETGFEAQFFKPITSFYTSPGFANELLHLYWADELTSGEAAPDEDEFVDILEVSLQQAFDYIESGEIIDAKTILAVYYWQNQQLKKD
jgi:ADP-ribose pyrophosphatase